MKKFRFRLQKLLQVKTYNKMQKQKELSQAERMRRMEEAHLAMLQQHLHNEIEALKTQKRDHVDVSRLTRSVYYQQRLLTNMATQERVITDACRKEEIKRGRLIEATKEEKTFEKLKERQQYRYLVELDHLMQKENDEISKNLFMRRSQE
ncbi:MAG: flagellar FliJ family protein [candidate division Zixibacteria bacterium]|nr:flagellar FliJ family protein [candidate division Zixibacteria bacterium]